MLTPIDICQAVQRALLLPRKEQLRLAQQARRHYLADKAQFLKRMAMVSRLFHAHAQQAGGRKAHPAAAAPAVALPPVPGPGDAAAAVQPAAVADSAAAVVAAPGGPTPSGAG